MSTGGAKGDIAGDLLSPGKPVKSGEHRKDVCHSAEETNVGLIQSRSQG